MNRLLQNELQHICPSETDIPPCDFTLQVIKSRLHCKQRTAVPPACCCPEHSGYRGYQFFDAILISPMFPTHVGSHRNFLVTPYFKVGFFRQTWSILSHLLLKVHITHLFGSTSARQLHSVQTKLRQHEHFQHTKLLTQPKLFHFRISHTYKAVRKKLKFVPL